MVQRTQTDDQQIHLYPNDSVQSRRVLCAGASMLLTNVEKNAELAANRGNNPAACVFAIVIGALYCQIVKPYERRLRLQVREISDDEVKSIMQAEEPNEMNLGNILERKTVMIFSDNLDRCHENFVTLSLDTGENGVVQELTLRKKKNGTLGGVYDKGTRLRDYTALEFLRNAIAHAGFSIVPHPIQGTLPFMATLRLWNSNKNCLRYAEVNLHKILQWANEFANSQCEAKSE